MPLSFPRKATPLVVKIGMFFVAAVLAPRALFGLSIAYRGFQTEDQPLLAGGIPAVFALVALVFLLRLFHARVGVRESRGEQGS